MCFPVFIYRVGGENRLKYRQISTTLLVILQMSLLLILVVLLILGRKSVHDEIIINASPEDVWKVLTDTDNAGQSAAPRPATM